VFLTLKVGVFITDAISSLQAKQSSLLWKSWPLELIDIKVPAL